VKDNVVKAGGLGKPGRTRYPGPITEARKHAHSLVEQGFASDEALARVLDRYPAELFDINLYDYDADGQVSLRTGARGKLSGDQLLEAIQAGRLWVNLRKAEQGCPALWAASMLEFDRIQAAYPGMKAVTNAGQLIISSPVARVPYHFDAAGVVLFHLRGRKRLYIYIRATSSICPSATWNRSSRARRPRNCPMPAPLKATPRSWIWSRARP